MENQKYNIELEVITPLCVGAGGEKDWIRGADYLQKDNKIYILDLQKAASEGIDLEKLSACFMQSNEEGILRLLGNKLDEVSSHVFSSPCHTTNPIKTFLRSQYYDLPVIAGSSIKGAIRSALFNFFSAKERETSLKAFINKDVNERGRRGMLNEYVFGEMKDGTDFMRFIQIGDIEMPSTTLVNTKIFNLRQIDGEWYGGWKHAMNSHTSDDYSPLGFNTLYECVVPKSKGLGNIVFAQNAFNLLLRKTQNIRYKEQKTSLIQGGARALFHAINQSTSNYLRKEKAFFDKYYAENSGEIEDNIDMLLRMTESSDDSYCLLKMAVGVGFHSITGDWRFNDYDNTGWRGNAKKYKSRKIADYDNQLQLMGFVKLRIVD